MRKPRIFIASAAESLDVADAFNVNLDHQAEVTVWKHGFSLSQNTIDSLIKISDSVDFAIFIFTPDDIANIRNNERNVTRDNVVFELGLFTGSLGKERCFIVKPRNIDMHIPTDLLGLTPADYNGERSDGNLEAAVNHPCVLIKKEVARLGLISPNLDIEKKARKTPSSSYKLGDVEHKLLATVLEGYTSSPEGISTWSVFNEFKNVQKGILSLAAIKLERAGYLDKSIIEDGQHVSYAFSVTADGIDYLLENEDLLHKANNRIPSQTKYDSLDDDIPF